MPSIFVGIDILYANYSQSFRRRNYLPLILASYQECCTKLCRGKLSYKNFSFHYIVVISALYIYVIMYKL